MQKTSVTPRETKYHTAIRHALAAMGHATNAELLRVLRVANPGLSATTVHRVTARLAERGEIGIAPPGIDGSIRYDTTIEPHDHFHCTSCGMLRDAYVKDEVVPIIERSIGDCQISGRLTVSGICKTCMTGGLA